MTKAKAQVASATTLSAQQADDNENKTSAEAIVAAEETKPDPAPSVNQDAYVASMEAQLAEMSRVVATVVKGKAPPVQKKPRPAGQYRLKSPFWDGRLRHEVGAELQFAKDKAPQSARFLG